MTTTLALHNCKTEQTLQAGQAHKFKVKAGERYRIVKRQGGDEQLLDNLVAKRSGDDLQLRYQDGTQVTLENYYVDCKALAACDITLPGPDGGLYRPGAESAAGAALADGSHLVYAYGAPDTLMTMAQGQPAMLSALAGLPGAQISYIPADSSTLAIAQAMAERWAPASASCAA